MRNLRTKRQYIVALLLTGFISVFVCDFLCDVGVISWEHLNSSSVKTDHHHRTEAHNHHDSHHHHDEHDHDQDDEEDDCCNDMVNQVYASLIKPEIKQSTFQPLVYHLLYQTYTVAFEPRGFSQKHLFFFYTNLPPPVSGFQIRVIIQSFLN